MNTTGNKYMLAVLSGFFILLFMHLNGLQAQEDSGKNAKKQQGEKIWSFSADELFSSPVVADGRVFIGGKKVYALSEKNGKKLWTFSPDKKVVWSYLSVSGDKVFAGTGGREHSKEDKIYALSVETGKEVWSVSVGDLIRPFLVTAGERVFVADRKNLFALSAKNGKKLWSFFLGDKSWGVPSVAGDRVYVTFDSTICAISAKSGKKIWSSSTDSGIVLYPVVAEGRVFAGAQKLYAFSADNGKKLWTFSPEKGKRSHSMTGIWSPPAVAMDRVFVRRGGEENQKISALLAKTGEEIWTFSPEEGGISPSVVTGGRVFIGGSKLYVLSAESGKENWTYSVDGAVGTPAVAGGRVFFVNKMEDRMDRLYALKTGITASKDWPMAGGNPARTGNSKFDSIEGLNKTINRIRKALKQGNIRKARGVLSSIARKEHPIVSFCRLVIQTVKTINSDKCRKAIIRWNKKLPHFYTLAHFPKHTESLVKVIQGKKRLMEHLRQTGKKLGNKSYKIREKATRHLRKAGIIAFPVLEKLKNSRTRETKNRARTLLKEVRRKWPQFFEK